MPNGVRGRRPAQPVLEQQRRRFQVVHDGVAVQVQVSEVSGHRIGTAEVEGAIGQHPKVAEAAVVGYPHDVKGQGIYAYVTLMAGAEPTGSTEGEIRQAVRRHIGPHASPDLVQFTPALPKTRSGKIMRRILRKIAEGETSPGALGDTSTLAEPGVVDDLVAGRR